MKLPFLICGVLTLTLWIALRDDPAADVSWSVSVSHNGKSKEETKITCGADPDETTRRIRSIVNAHLTQLEGKTPQFRIWRSTTQPFDSQVIAERAAEAGKKVSLIYTQTESIGPVYASTGPNGVVRVFVEDFPGKPEIMAEGHAMDLDLQQSIITRVLAERLQDAADYERTRKP